MNDAFPHPFTSKAPVAGPYCLYYPGICYSLCLHEAEAGEPENQQDQDQKDDERIGATLESCHGSSLLTVNS
jgi:hypothetical protein